MRVENQVGLSILSPLTKYMISQCRYYKPAVLVMCFILPTLVPWYLWGETFQNSLFFATLFRYAAGLNATWLVNSAAHMYGYRPYDKTINPRENILVSLGAVGKSAVHSKTTSSGLLPRVLGYEPGKLDLPVLYPPSICHCTIKLRDSIRKSLKVKPQVLCKEKRVKNNNAFNSRFKSNPQMLCMMSPFGLSSSQSSLIWVVVLLGAGDA